MGCDVKGGLAPVFASSKDAQCNQKVGESQAQMLGLSLVAIPRGEWIVVAQEGQEGQSDWSGLSSPDRQSGDRGGLCGGSDGLDASGRASKCGWRLATSYLVGTPLHI